MVNATLQEEKEVKTAMLKLHTKLEDKWLGLEICTRCETI